MSPLCTLLFINSLLKNKVYQFLWSGHIYGVSFLLCSLFFILVFFAFGPFQALWFAFNSRVSPLQALFYFHIYAKVQYLYFIFQFHIFLFSSFSNGWCNYDRKAANSFTNNLNILILFSYYQTKDFKCLASLSIKEEA